MLLSYSVAPEHRRKGIGAKVIAMLPDIIERENIQCRKIIVEVYETNAASNKIFLDAGYSIDARADYGGTHMTLKFGRRA